MLNYSSPDGIVVHRDVDFIAEANHRIANNISILANLVRTSGREAANNPGITGKAIRQIFDELNARLEAVATLHRLLVGCAGAPTIEITSYFETLANVLTSSLALESHITLRVVAQRWWRAPPEKALPLGLMVAELVTNAIKHAHPAQVPGTVVVTCRSDSAGGLVVEVSDDGVGLPEGFDPAEGGHVGFRLLRSLAKQVDASLSFRSHQLGLQVEIRAPKLASEPKAANLS